MSMSSNGNNGFGRRRPPDPKARTGAGNPPPSNGTDASPGRDGVKALAAVLPAPPLVWQLRGLLIGVGIVFFLIAVYVVAMKGFGRALDKAWVENAGYPGVEDAYKRSSRTDVALEAVHNDCKSRSDFVQLDNNRTRALDGFQDLSVGLSALNTSATYLSCLMGHPPERLCKAAHRDHLIAALKDYYRLMMRVREERMMSTGGPFAATRMTLLGTSGRDVYAATASVTDQTDGRVLNGVRRLLGDGYLSRRDLAPVLGPQRDLELKLQGVVARKAGCP
jgi:Na+-transporting methylmalonyl-CoA/oxaloacetate decarboxylase gamma subunit